MKTYANHGTCQHHNGSAYPVSCDGTIRWASGDDVRDLGEVVETATFRPRQGDSTHDRVSRLWDLGGGRGFAIETILSRDYPGPWPHLKLFASIESARECFGEIVARLARDGRWQNVSDTVA
jgi:hypothetical protein